LPDGKTGSRLGVLPLVVGMRVILRDNLATHIGLVNGAEGTVVKVGLHPDEQLPVGLFSVRPGQLPPCYHLRHPPEYVIVKFDHLKQQQLFPGTSDMGEVMIVPEKVSFQYKGWGPTRTIYRTQLPLTPCQSMTVNMMQGRTADDMMCDLNIMERRGDKLTTLYVLLSRGQAAHRVRLLRSFHHGQLHRERNADIANDEERLHFLEQETLRNFAADHRVLDYVPPPRPLTEHEALTQGTQIKCRHGKHCSQSCMKTFSVRKPTAMQNRQGSPAAGSAHAAHTRSSVDFALELRGTQLKGRTRAHHQRNLSVTLLKRKQCEQAEQPARKRSRHNDAKTASPTETAPWCHSKLHLTEVHRTDIINIKMLDDEVIGAFQMLLQEAFPDISGWQAPALAVHKELGYIQRTGLSVQIHNNLSSHWLTSARTRAGIFVADSLLTSPNPAIARQLVDIYCYDNQSFIDVTFLSCQRQIGSLQCGDFSIFNASIFAMCIDAKSSQLERLFSSAHFDQGAMRDHMLECLKAGQFLSPLQLSSTPRVVLLQPTTYRIDCFSLTWTTLQ